MKLLWKSMIISWNFMNISWNLMVIWWKWVIIPRYFMASHDESMKAHRFSMVFNRFRLETSWWASCGPRGPPGAGEDFYLSRGRRLYCLGFVRFLSRSPACDSHWNSIKLLQNFVPIQWKCMDFHRDPVEYQ